MDSVTPLALLQSRLSSMVGMASGYVDTLPKPMKRRVKALKKLQLDSLQVEAELAKDILQLEIKYADKFDGIWRKRRDIVAGKHEPNDDECDFPSPAPSDTESVQSEDGEGQEKSGGEGTIAVKSEADSSSEPPPHGFTDETPGLPEFWLTIFKNVEPIGVNIQPHDEEILAHLTDITLKQSIDPLSFTLEFHFSPNQWFTNPILYKTYELSCEIDTEDPFSFEGLEIRSAKGCKIDWKEGKNVSVKTVTKKQKHKTKGSVRSVPKVVKADSFFNFFDPVILPEDDDASIDEETQALLQADLEIGELIKQRIIPRAVLYFTGEALEDDDESDEYDDEEDEEDEEEEDDEGDDEDSGDNDADKDKKKPKGGRMAKRSGAGPQQQECKQQ